jgi:hypothetical protein
MNDFSENIEHIVCYGGLPQLKRPHFRLKNSDENFKTLEFFFETLENFFETSNEKKIPLDEIFAAPNGMLLREPSKSPYFINSSIASTCACSFFLCGCSETI